MRFRINGIEKEYSGDPELSLLKYLRGTEHIFSAKDGCSPQAACGACTVELNGKAILSCVTPMSRVENGAIITTEGIEKLIQNAFIVSFAEKGAVQCGFCTPGIIMRAQSLVRQNPDPSRDEILQSLKYHLCRCTGYIKIIDAIRHAAKAIREREFLDLSVTDGKVGSRHIRYDVEKMVLGNRPFVDDLLVNDLKYGVLKFSEHPRAIIKDIDVTEAEKIPGVLRVFTAKDIPGNRYVGLITADWPIMIDEGETTHYIGDVLAGVVADEEDIAREAVNKIRILYDVLEPITDPQMAMHTGSAAVHEKRNNLLEKSACSRGDAREALDRSAFKVQHTFQTQRVEHGYLEPESCLARPWGDGIMVYTQSQGIYEDQRQISGILNISKEKINVHLMPNGGGFGGKEDLSIQGQTALFAFLLKKPVKITLNREESIRLHPKRHPIELNYQVGCDENGKLMALKARIVGDTGAYASVGAKVLERSVGHSTGAYYIPAIDVESYTVYTNNIPNGAMRGFGANQANFAMECCLDELCELGGFDRWKFRYENALKDGDKTATGQILKGGVGIRRTLEEIKPYYDNSKYSGLACGIKNTGIGNGMNDESTVRIEIFDAEKVRVHHGWTEMGQGVNTMAVQVVCQETGLSPKLIEVVNETRSETPVGMTTASRATSLLGNALIVACKQLKKDLTHYSLLELKGKNYSGLWTCDWTTTPGDIVDDIITHYSYSYATQLVVLDEEGKIDCIYAAHDAGKIMNPTLFEGQIEGSVHMGLGYAVSEELALTNGIPDSFRLQACGILRAKDMPEVKVIGVEESDPMGPYGAKGVGEIGLVPTAPAVANAFYSYDKKRRYVLPIKDYRWRKTNRGAKGERRVEKREERKEEDD